MLNHDFEPLFEVFLHANAASFEQVLDPFNLALQILQFRVLSLVPLLLLIDALLNLVFFVSAHELAIIVNHSTQGILLADLLNIVRQVFDRLPRLVDISAELLAPCILFLE